MAKAEKPSNPFSHIDETGAARMVDVSRKDATSREAVARGEIFLGAAIAEAVAAQSVKKGDVLVVARVAGIMAAKRTPEAIPLCHPLALTGCDVNFVLDAASSRLTATCRVSTTGVTGVEMEALSGVSGALLAVYDMCKAIDKGMVIGPIWLVEKSGGKSGTWREREWREREWREREWRESEWPGSEGRESETIALEKSDGRPRAGNPPSGRSPEGGKAKSLGKGQEKPSKPLKGKSERSPKKNGQRDGDKDSETVGQRDG